MEKRKKCGGREKGTPNKVTADARQAIAIFVNKNADRLQGWLDKIADGVLDKTGEFKIPPNPQRAFELFMGVVEYHVPKLSRSEVKVDASHTHRSEPVSELDSLLERAGAAGPSREDEKPLPH